MRRIILAFLIFCCSAHAQHREEIESLEQAYEARARAALNTVLKPFDYSIVLAVDIERDEKRLNEIETEYEKFNLPGMPGSESMLGGASLANKIYSLRSRISVHVVLNESVSKATEDTVKQILKMKLQVDEASGDTISIARARLPGLDGSSADPLPELSWRMWILVLIVSLIGLAGLVILWNNRKNAKPEPLPIPFQSPPTDSESNKDNGTEATQSPQGLATTSSHLERIFEYKEQILSMATQYPKAMSDALQKLFSQGFEKEILLMAESFGWEVSKKVFSTLPARTWARVGHILKERKESESAEVTAAAVEICYRHLLARFLELSDEDQRSPFSFLNRIEKHERDELLVNESPTTLAVISAVSDPGLANDIFQSLDAERQEILALEISKINQLPAEAVEATARQLLLNLQAIRKQPKFQADGTASVVNLMKGASPSQELAIIKRLMVSAPEKLDLIRKQKLIYPDLAIIAPETLSEVAQNLDVETMVRAFAQGFPEVRDAIIKALPTKKARMVSGDLERPGLKYSVSDSDNSKRLITEQIELWIRAKGIKLDDLFAKSTLLEAA